MKEGKKMNTNTKVFMAKVQKMIKEDYGWTPVRIKKQIKVFLDSSTIYAKCKKLVTGGCFDCYCSQVAETMAELFDCSVDEIWKYYKNDEEKLWAAYCHIFAKNLKCMATGERCYL